MKTIWKTQKRPKKAKAVIPANEFRFDPADKTCICPAGESMQLKKQCMRNPASTDDRNENGLQVSFVFRAKKKSTYTDWMKQRADSDKGKLI